VPILRDEGFRGSGRTFRRVQGLLIHVLNLQGSMYSKQFAVNLGFHLSFLPGPTGRPVEPTKIVESECEFRRRLTAGGSDHWWVHGDDARSIEEAVRSAVEMYVEHGRRAWSEVATFPESLEGVTPESLITDVPLPGGFGNTLVRTALAFARIRQYQGDATSARQFAKVGVAKLGAATGLRGAFAKFLADHE